MLAEVQAKQASLLGDVEAEQRYTASERAAAQAPNDTTARLSHAAMRCAAALLLHGAMCRPPHSLLGFAWRSVPCHSPTSYWPATLCYMMRVADVWHAGLTLTRCVLRQQDLEQRAMAALEDPELSEEGKAQATPSEGLFYRVPSVVTGQELGIELEEGSRSRVGVVRVGVLR